LVLSRSRNPDETDNWVAIHRRVPGSRPDRQTLHRAKRTGARLSQRYASDRWVRVTSWEYCNNSVWSDPTKPRTSIGRFLSLGTLFGTSGEIFDLLGECRQVGRDVVALELRDSLTEHGETLVQGFDGDSENVNLF
jgi:hypothetical protein